jgi:hypothetical protein
MRQKRGVIAVLVLCTVVLAIVTVVLAAGERNLSRRVRVLEVTQIGSPGTLVRRLLGDPLCSYSKPEAEGFWGSTLDSDITSVDVYHVVGEIEVHVLLNKAGQVVGTKYADD